MRVRAYWTCDRPRKVRILITSEVTSAFLPNIFTKSSDFHRKYRFFWGGFWFWGRTYCSRGLVCYFINLSPMYLLGILCYRKEGKNRSWVSKIIGLKIIRLWNCLWECFILKIHECPRVHNKLEKCQNFTLSQISSSKMVHFGPKNDPRFFTKCWNWETKVMIFWNRTIKGYQKMQYGKNWRPYYKTSLVRPLKILVLKKGPIS